jgi:hypothetical protein
MKTEIQWIDPKEQIPPFKTRIMVMLGGQGSLDCMQTWERYGTVFDAIITKHSPNDPSEREPDGEPTEYEEFTAERDKLTAYQQYQFDVHVWYQWKFENRGGEFGDDAEWYSDAILLWAPLPDFSAAIPPAKA